MRLKKRKLPKLKPVELFNSLDIWLHNWEKLNETGNPKWLIKSDRERAKNPRISKDRLERAFFDLHNSYCDATDAGEKMADWRTLILQRMEARLKYAKGDKVQINFIENFDRMIKDMMKSTGRSFSKIRMEYEVAARMTLNSKTTTLKRFIEFTEVIQEQNKPRPNNE